MTTGMGTEVRVTEWEEIQADRERRIKERVAKGSPYHPDDVGRLPFKANATTTREEEGYPAGLKVMAVWTTSSLRPLSVIFKENGPEFSGVDPAVVKFDAVAR